MALRKAHVLKMSGEFLEFSASEEDLPTVHNLKALLAGLDPCSPPTAFVKLLHRVPPSSSSAAISDVVTSPDSVELADDAQVPFEALWERPAQVAMDDPPPLQYLVCPDMKAVVLKCCPELKLEDDCWPTVNGRDYPLQAMFNDTRNTNRILMNVEHRSAASHVFWSALRYIIMGLSSEVVNTIHANGRTILHDMIVCLGSIDSDTCIQKLEDIVVDFVQRTDLEQKTINSLAFVAYPPYISEIAMPFLYLCLYEKKARRNSRSISCGKEAVALALLRCHATSPEHLGFILPSNGDTMLHHILEPVSLMHVGDKSQGSAELCKVFASRFNLLQLCCRNRDGVLALSYAEALAENVGRFRPEWLGVRDAIADNMVTRYRESSLSFQDRVEIAEVLENALQAAEANDIDCTRLLRQVVIEFHTVVWKIAEETRQDWLASGWIFRSDAHAAQTLEVRHFLLRY